MKKKKEKLHAFAHIRNSWSINPRTRVKESKKGYRRNDKHKGGAFQYEKDHLFSLPIHRPIIRSVIERSLEAIAEHYDNLCLIDQGSVVPLNDKRIKRSDAA